MKPVRAGRVFSRSGGEWLGQCLGGVGSLREERLADSPPQAARRELEDRGVAERQAGGA
jgi:hypothetical protein